MGFKVILRFHMLLYYKQDIGDDDYEKNNFGGNASVSWNIRIFKEIPA